MTPIEVKRITRDRLTRWIEVVSNEHATPYLLLSCGHDAHAGRWVLTACQGITDGELLIALEAVALLIRQGNPQRSEGHD